MKDKKFTRNWRKTAFTMLLVSFSLSTACGIASCKKKDDDKPVHVDGLGVFYYDTGIDEYQLALEDNYKATFIANGESKSATYAINGNALTLTFSDGTTMQATLAKDELTLNYDEGQYRFLKKVYYTVSYEEAGGSAVADTVVVNGQSFAKPADPQKVGHEFLGWYTDSEYTKPYSFAQVVTGDLTLYAQWAVVDPAMKEYTVDFDLGYDGAVKPADIKTIAGKLYNAPKPTRDGYKFCGWWVSAYENGEKLTYKYNADIVFKANTTLFALWEAEDMGSKLSAPEVEVGDNLIKWNGLKGVSVYKLKVTGPVGFSTIDEDVSGTSYTVDFANAPAGDYEISVTAVAQSGASNNSETVKRYYKNKAVGRVSKFTVLDGNVLLFNRVENATNYYITVDCGNDYHTHTTFSLGDSTNYNFSACEMQEGGIKFTVTATADGYAPTTSETFVYKRDLAKVEGLTVNEETQVLSWYAVENATNYYVTVTCGDDNHTHTVVDNGSKTTFSIKECPAGADGKVRVSVLAVSNGYNSSAPTEFVYAKTKLATPSDIKVVMEKGAYKLVWKEVEGATEYTIKIDNVVLTSTTNEKDITTEISWVDETAYNVEIKAKDATSESVWSDTTKIYYGVMSQNLKYKSGRVYWESVIGATGYQVQIDGQITTYDDATVTSAPVTFTKEGTNEVYVRYKVNNTYPGNWVKLVVDNVRAIEFDVRGGSEVDTIYRVLGDECDLPKPTKAGYDFAGWYNTPKGPESNGKLYDDITFNETSELMLYAYWTPATYEITYEAGAGGTLSATTGEVTYLQSFKLEVPTVSDGSKVFMGWFAGPDASAQQITDDRGNSIKNWSLKQGTTLYAHYITDVLSFTYLENQGVYSVSKGRNIHRVTSVTIPEKYEGITVGVVEGYAFEGRTNLVSINIPDTVTIIERETSFYGCKGLQEINVYHVDGNNTAIYSSVDGVLLKKDDIVGQNQLFYYPLARKGAYTIPDGVTEIPLNLFRESAVTEIVVPTSVAIIRENAFRDCAKLEKITFAEGGTDALTIEDGAFSSCTSLVEITLPSRLTELELNEETRTLTLFDGCDALAYVHVEKGSLAYGSVEGVLTNGERNKLLYCPAARTGAYTIPKGIVEIGERAFYNCSNLTQIIIPGYVETIGDYAFYGNSKVARVEFASGAIAGMELTIGDYAFAEMSNLKTVEFSTGSAVTKIGKYAFANAKGLRGLTIPASMALIDDHAFDNATALKTVTFAPNGEDLIFGNYVFNECTGLTRVELPASVKKLNLGVFDGCINIAEIIVDDANTNYKDIDGIVFSADGKELVFFPKGRKPVDETTGEYVIPEGVETIAEGAFKGMRYIEKIVINNTITYIGKGAFANSAVLKTLTFAEGNDEAKLTICESAFEGCSGIQTLTLPTRTETIEAKAFYNVSIQSITFPAGLTTIGDYAFANSALKSVEVPAGLTTLGTNVFDSCASLKTVTFATGFSGKEIPVGTFQKSAIETIEIPASIEKIGYLAFNDCASLKTVTFASGTADLVIGYMPEGQTNVSSTSGVFVGCNNLESVIIPDRATVIGEYAFANCAKLATVTINTTSKLQRIGRSAFENCTGLSSIYIPKVVNSERANEQSVQEWAIAEGAFKNTGLTSIEFAMDGEGDMSIGVEAFSGTRLTTITLPKRLAPIDTIDNKGMYGTFDGVDRGVFNDGITEINIQDGKGLYYGSESGVLYRVKDEALSTLLYAPKQKTGKIIVPKTVTLVEAGSLQNTLVSEIEWEDANDVNGLPLTIGDSALQDMPNLKNISFPERTVAIGASQFNAQNNYSYIETVYIPKNVETIGSSMFREAYSLKQITFADGCKLKAIPESMFYVQGGSSNKAGANSNQLQSIRVPASVTKIGKYAFRGCNNVTSFGFESGSKITRLEGGIFQGMTLTELAIPDSVADLDGSVFNGMNSLVKLTLPANLTQISTSIPTGAGSYTNAFLFNGCPALKEVVIPESNQYFKTVDGVVYTENGKQLVYYPSAKEVGTEIIEAGEPTGRYDGVYVTPAGVESIGAYAFAYNINITELVISADLLTVGREAFANRSNLKKLTFADRITTLTLADQAFYRSGLGNNGADTLVIPETVEIEGDNVFASTKYGKVQFAENNTTKALNQTFRGCAYLTEITGLPEVLTSMSDTFSGCSNLKKVEFVEGAYVETMQGTFYGCKALESIVIPKVGSLNVNGSQEGAFQNCTKLKNVTISSCGYIGMNTFMGCEALESFVMPDTVSQLGASAFSGCVALENVTFSNGLENIPANAFNSCRSLQSVVLGGFITSIDDSAFKGCTALTEVILPDGLVTIGNGAFEGAKLVEEVVLPEGLQTIGNNAFKGWSALKAIVIPASVTTIGESAFSGCSNVMEITIPEGAVLETLGNYAFEGITNVQSFHIPATLTNLGIGVFKDWASLTSITVESGNEQFAFENDILWNSTYTEMIYVLPTASGVLRIPETVSSLARGVFAYLKISGVVIPETITEIPDEAFRGCVNLESVTFPKYLKRIGEAAFEGCTSLKSITIPASVQSVYDRKTNTFSGKGGKEITYGYYAAEMYDGIGKYAFANCTNLETVLFEEGGANRLSFGDYAFYNCSNLKSISIPKRVSSAGTLFYSVEMLQDQGITNYVDNKNVDHFKTVQGVGRYCFAMCTNLESVVFEEEGVGNFADGLVIQLGAFTGCTKLASVTFSSAIRDFKDSMIGERGDLQEKYSHAIEGRVFDGCMALTNVTFPEKSDNQVTVRNTAFEVNVTLPKYVTLNTSKASGDEANLWLYGCSSCCFYGDACNGHTPVQDGVVKATDITNGMFVTDSVKMYGSKKITLAFNGMNEQYCDVTPTLKMAGSSYSTRYEYTYRVVSYNETSITLELTVVVSNVETRGAKYSATIDLNTMVLTIGSKIS